MTTSFLGTPILDKLVRYFNQKVLDLPEPELGLMEPDSFALSMHQLREEINEIELAYHQGNLVGIVDGLIDLDYFLKGVVYKHGISPRQYHFCFLAVHNANMNKKMGKKKGREGYGEAADAVKSIGWLSPEVRIQLILGLDDES